MKTFADNKGRTWTIAITVDAIKQIKALIGVDLLEVVDGKLLDRLAGDPILLCDVIYAACKAEADAQEISDQDFGAAMAGNAIDAATTALLEELVDFFPSARRGLLRKALATLHRLEAQVVQAAGKVLDGDTLDKAIEDGLTEGETEDLVRQRLSEARRSQASAGDSSTKSPASPASPPDR